LPTIVVATRIPESLADALAARAYEDHSTVSRVMRTILTEQLVSTTVDTPETQAA
jgi:hypothetical protein